MLRTMAAAGEARQCWLFFANPTVDRILFREELDSLTGKLNLKLIHVIQDAPDGWRGERGYLDREMLLRHSRVRECAALHWFICGPPPMLAAAEEELQPFASRQGGSKSKSSTFEDRMRRMKALWLVALTTALVLLLAFGFALQQQAGRSDQDSMQAPEQ